MIDNIADAVSDDEDRPIGFPFLVPCYFREKDEWLPGIIWTQLSSNQLAKVLTEDGWWRDIWWSKVKSPNVAALMDELDYGEGW